MTSADGGLESRIRSLMRDRVPGLSVAVVGPEGERWMRSFGTGDLRSDTAMTPQTAFLWFSMTKIVTATAAMRLVDADRLRLDDSVVDHYPPFALMEPRDRAARVTVAHLLGHSSGLANPVPVRWVHPVGAEPPSVGVFLEKVLHRHRKLRFEPGSRARYSNVGFLVLGQVIEAAAGRPFADYVTAEVLTPLAMSATGFRYAEEGPSAVGYQRRRSPMTPLLRVLLPHGIMDAKVDGYVSFRPFNVDGPAYGGLVGPVADAARFLRMHLRDGELDGRRVLAAESARRMRVIATPGKPFDLGLGWFRPANARSASPAFVQHRGDGGAFATDMRIYPSLSLGVVTMANATSYDRDALAALLVQRFRS